MSESVFLDGPDLRLVVEALRGLADHYSKSLLASAYAGEGRGVVAATAYRKLTRCGELARRIDDFPEALLTRASTEEVTP